MLKYLIVCLIELRKNAFAMGDLVTNSIDTHTPSVSVVILHDTKTVLNIQYPIKILT